MYNTIDNFHEPTIFLNEVTDLSNTEIVEKLFTIYLEHYKDKPILDEQRIKVYKYIGASEKYAIAEGEVFFVTYSFEQHFWNEYWEIGGHQTTDGMTQKSRYVVLIKEKDQFRLDIHGIDPPTPILQHHNKKIP